MLRSDMALRQAVPRVDDAPAMRVELAGKIARQIGTAEKRITEVPGLALFRRTAPSEPCPATYEPSVIVMAQGRKRVELGGRALVYDSSRYLLTSIDLPALSQVVEASERAPALAMVVKLQMPVIREVLSREEIALPAAAPSAPAMGTAETTAQFLSPCLRLVDLLDCPEDIAFLSGMIVREIIYRVMQGPEGGRLRSIATQGEQSHRTAKAISWIVTNYAMPLRVEQLAEISGMAVSTFHHNFRSLTSMSPLQYQKQIRLQTARRRMLMDGLDAANAAHEVGYESPSQFSREYSRFYGRPPVRDARTLRGAVFPAAELAGGA